MTGAGPGDRVPARSDRPPGPSDRPAGRSDRPPGRSDLPGGPDRTRGQSVARAALVVAVITVLSRLAGFGRSLVFTRAVGTGCIGDVYTTANTVPNVLFDIVAGGMLSALVVPLLAPALHGGDRDRAAAITSALLTWTAVILVPLAVVVTVCARPITAALLRDQGGQCPGAVDVGARMLVVFAPQVVLYGVGIVLAGVLTAGERFTWPALAPLLSSVVVIAAYAGYGRLAGTAVEPAKLSGRAEYLLSGGTTLGVLILTMCLVPVVARTGLRVRPTLRFPAGIAATVARSAAWGATTLAASEISTLVMIVLANSHGPTGTLVVTTTAQTVFLLPWAVLSLPIATTTFPRLAAAWQGGDTGEVVRRLAVAARTVVVAGAAGTALLIAVATPAGHVFLRRTAPALNQFAGGVTAFALGLLGWSLVALLARALYAVQRVRTAALAQVAGQLVVMIVDVVLVTVLPDHSRALALGLGNSIGVSVSAALLLITARRAGVLHLDAGWWRHVGACAGAAAVAALAGWAVGRRSATTLVPAALDGAAAAVVAGVVFVLVLAVLDRHALAQLRALTGLLRPGRAA